MVLPDDVSEVSPLNLMGYHVGKNGLPTKERHKLLQDAFLGPIPASPDIDEWGDADTDVRLRKMANHLAGLVRLDKKKRTRDMSEAIRMKEADLAFLKQALYDGRFDGSFTFPSTD